jgi:hypothetical protein
VWCVRADASSSSMMNAGVWLLLLKSRRSLLERPSCLSGSSFVLIFYSDVFNNRLLLLPRQLDGALSSIIILATVVSLYISFAMSSDKRYLHVIFCYLHKIFWISLSRPND